MVLPALAIGALIIGALVILPRTGFKLGGNANEAARQAKADEEERKRGNKGAIGNTIDFFFGNGATAAAFGARTKGSTTKPITPRGGPAARRHRGRGRIS